MIFAFGQVEYGAAILQFKQQSREAFDVNKWTLFIYVVTKSITHVTWVWLDHGAT